MSVIARFDKQIRRIVLFLIILAYWILVLILLNFGQNPIVEFVIAFLLYGFFGLAITIYVEYKATTKSSGLEKAVLVAIWLPMLYAIAVSDYC